MPRISDKKRDKISEQILAHLFSIAPQSQFTATISAEIARDEEFTKVLLAELAKKQLVIKITKNQDGKKYLRRERWRLSNAAFDIYKKRQQPRQSFNTLDQSE